MIYPWTRDQIQSPISSSLFGHSGQKWGENFEGELRKSFHSVRGSIGLGLETLVIGSQAVYLCLVFSFYNCWFMFMLLLLLFKTSIHFAFINSILYSVLEFVTISMLCSIFLVLLDINNMS